MLTPAQVRVLIADDHPVVRDGLASQMRAYPDIQLVGTASTGAEAVAKCGGLRPDLILLDVRLPDMLADEVVPQVRAASPHTRVLLFTAHPSHPAVQAALFAGASGLLVKDSSATTICEAVQHVARNGVWTSHPAAEPRCLVTPREYEVVRLVAAGLTNQEIAADLRLSVNTVKSYLRSIMAKLDARNRPQLITNARDRGVL